MVTVFEILIRNLTREAEENNENLEAKVGGAPAYINTNTSKIFRHLSRFAQR
jgi:hypothetical protein